jgi:hypothetical protein
VRRWWAVSILLVITACSSGSDPQARPRSTTTTDPSSTTTTVLVGTTAPPSTSTTTPVDAPPDLVQTGDNYVAILESLHAYVQWLGMHPDVPATQVAVPGSNYESFLNRTAAALLQAGAAWDRPQELLTDVALSSTAISGVALVTAIDTPVPEAQAVDSSGAVVSTGATAGGPVRVVFELRLGTDNLWRVADVTVIGQG